MPLTRAPSEKTRQGQPLSGTAIAMTVTTRRGAQPLSGAAFAVTVTTRRRREAQPLS